MWHDLGDVVAVNFINVVSAIVILVIGWIVALILSSAANKAVSKTKLSDYLAKITEDEDDKEEGITSLNIETWVSKLVFYVVMFFVLIAMFQALELSIVAEPFGDLLSQVFSYLPMLVGALALLLLAWILATVVRVIVSKALKTAKIDDKFDEQTDMTNREMPLSQLIAKISYWLVILLFLPAILTALRLDGILQPVQGMISTALTFVPNIGAAILLIAVGWIAARILRKVTAALLSTAGVDKLSEKVGISTVIGGQKLSRLAGVLVYAFIIIISIISALNALALEAITQPASNMLDMILSALPAIFAAILVLVIAFAVGRIVKGLVGNVLNAAGFDNILSKLGITQTQGSDKWTPSEAVSYVLFAVIMLFATIEAAELLGFGLFAQLISELLVFISHIIIGLAIFGIALYLANLAHDAIKVSDSKEQNILAKIAKYAILVLGGAMALQRMGLADEIIMLAFGITLGGVVITGILAFGLGGKEIARRELDNMITKYKENKEE